MSIGALQTEADLQRWLQNELARPDALLPGTLRGEALALDSVHGERITPESITGSLIVTGTITGSLIAANTIEATNIAAETITGAKIAANTITGEKIVAGSISTGALEAESITTELLKAEAVTAAKIKSGTIEAAQIKAGTITGDRIAATTITAGNIVSGTITATQIATGTITADRMSVSQLAAITADLGSITAGTITGATIRTAASGPRVVIDSEGIRGLDVEGTAKFKFETGSGLAFVTGVLSSEDGSEIPTKHLAGQIKETQIEEGAISTPLLAANSVVAAKIAGETITGSKIAASTITASKLSVSTLSAITANLGTITAGTITGATFRTSASEETVMDANGLALRSWEEPTEQPPTKHVVAWRTSSNKVRHHIYGTSYPVNPLEDYLYVVSNPNKEVRLGRVYLHAYNSAGKRTGLNLETNTITVEVPNATFRTILNESNQSDFLQLTSTAKRKINFSAATVTKTNAQTANKEVEHGLGTTPVVVLATTGSRDINAATFNYTSTKFTTEVRDITGANITADTTVYWIAIG